MGFWGLGVFRDFEWLFGGLSLNSQGQQEPDLIIKYNSEQSMYR